MLRGLSRRCSQNTGRSAGPSRTPDVVVITADAAARVREIQAASGARYLRVSIKVTGYDGMIPTGFQDSLDLTDDVDPETDYLGRSQGILVVVDRRTAAFFAKGVTVDWEVDADGPGSFRILGVGDRAPR